MAAHNFKDLTGQKFDHLTVLKFNKQTQKWICQCDCESRTIVEKRAGHLQIKGRIQSCGCANKKKFIDLTNKRFGHLTVKEYSKELGEWLCKCDCGAETFKKSGHLRDGLVATCGMGCPYSNNTPTDMNGQKFGNLTVIGYDASKNRLCKCICGKIVSVSRTNLLNGSTTSCGCMNPNAFKDISGQTFNYLTALNYLGNGYWECVCHCGNIKKVKGYDIITGHTKSCGCMSHISGKEQEILDYIRSIYGGDIVSHNKSILCGQELDIYIPDRKIAIEFNGNYWHSLKDKNYHQNKTIQCSKQGIHLIHIFEYEWDNKDTQNKLKNYIYSVLNNNNTIYARNTVIKEISKEIAEEFLNKYHLQGYTASTINIGCFNNENLTGVMTFGKPHFNNKYQYELLRLCWLPTTTVIGGTEKLFTFFINKYNPQSIICYSDISKFTGNVYLRCGFKPIQPNPITKPSYVWVSHHSNEVLKRYQTQKQKLISKGLGDINQTEDEIMILHDYYKIYDSGNIRLEWRNKDGY